MQQLEAKVGVILSSKTKTFLKSRQVQGITTSMLNEIVAGRSGGETRAKARKLHGREREGRGARVYIKVGYGEKAIEGRRRRH